jgi:hypothetical protein
LFSDSNSFHQLRGVDSDVVSLLWTVSGASVRPHQRSHLHHNLLCHRLAVCDGLQGPRLGAEGDDYRQGQRGQQLAHLVPAADSCLLHSRADELLEQGSRRVQHLHCHSRLLCFFHHIGHCRLFYSVQGKLSVIA